MELIPALDLRGGRVVRLRQGDFARLTDYGGDPVAVARRWVGEGARRLHLVDLDGAEQGRPVQAALVRDVVAGVDAACQVAGGLRDAPAVATVLAAGADRAVLGTALLADPDFGRGLVERHGNARIVAALDVRDGRAVGAGWVLGAAGVPLLEALGALLDAGLTIVAVTAIVRDGLLLGPDLDLLTAVRQAAPGAHLIASGGVATLDDLRALHQLGVDAAILGRALYEGSLDFGAALAAVEE